MDPVSPDFVKNVGELPIVTICLLIIFGQFVLVAIFLREIRRDIKELTTIISELVTGLARRRS